MKQSLAFLALGAVIASIAFLGVEKMQSKSAESAAKVASGGDAHPGDATRSSQATRKTSKSQRNSSDVASHPDGILNFDGKSWNESLANIGTLNSLSEDKELMANLKRIGKILNEADYQFRGILVEQLLGTLAKHNSPEEIIDWVERSRGDLKAMIGKSDKKFESTIYDYFLEKLTNENPSLEGHPGIKQDLLPLALSQTKIWENSSLEGLNDEQKNAVQAKTLLKLTHSFQYEAALKMYLDEGCTVQKEKSVISQILTRDWFWENEEVAMKLISGSPRGVGRDEALSQAIDLIREVEPESAVAWVGNVDSETLRASLLEKINNKN